jgi:hypothetical protein
MTMVSDDKDGTGVCLFSAVKGAYPPLYSVLTRLGTRAEGGVVDVKGVAASRALAVWPQQR